MLVDLHIPCYVDRYFPSIGISMVKVLQRYGCVVNYPIGQTCCGMPALYDGFTDECKAAGEYMIRLFQNDRPIVSCGTVCASVLKCHYQDLFHNSSLHNEYRHMQQHIFEFCTFLTDVLGIRDAEKRLRARAVFIGGCAGVNHCISHQPALTLLSRIEMLQLLSLPSAGCCGWGGTLAQNDEKKSMEMATCLINEVIHAGADLIITNEAGCLMHLQRVMQQQGINLEIIHIASLLD
jgi:L-lactate dehydrogenase complex protein LldE